MGRIIPYIMEHKKWLKPPTSIYIYFPDTFRGVLNLEIAKPAKDGTVWLRSIYCVYEQYESQIDSSHKGNDFCFLAFDMARDCTSIGF